MASLVNSALGSNLSGKLISVEEMHGSDAHFVLSCVMARDQQAICLVALHNTIGHYLNVSAKLGVPLAALREKTLVQFIEPLKQLHVSRKKETILKGLLADIRVNLKLLSQKSDQLLLVIDDVSDLLDIGISSQDALSFLQYCSTDMTDLFPSLSVVILSHIIEEDDESRLVGACLGHLADVRVVVRGLPTGGSKDVSGSIRVVDNSTRDDVGQCGRQDLYHFRLLDRKVELFAPGSVRL